MCIFFKLVTTLICLRPSIALLAVLYIFSSKKRKESVPVAENTENRSLTAQASQCNLG